MSFVTKIASMKSLIKLLGHKIFYDKLECNVCSSLISAGQVSGIQYVKREYLADGQNDGGALVGAVIKKVQKKTARAAFDKSISSELD